MSAVVRLEHPGGTIRGLQHAIVAEEATCCGSVANFALLPTRWQTRSSQRVARPDVQRSGLAMTHCRLIDQRRGMHIFLVLVHDDSSFEVVSVLQRHANPTERMHPDRKPPAIPLRTSSVCFPEREKGAGRVWGASYIVSGTVVRPGTTARSFSSLK